MTAQHDERKQLGLDTEGEADVSRSQMNLDEPVKNLNLKIEPLIK